MSALARRPDRYGRAALALYRDLPLGVRAHVHLRWWSAPFPSIEAALPATGRILEIGCGHGLFSAYAAAAGPGRVLRGVDIDEDKLRWARQAAAPVADRLEFSTSPSGAVPDGPWDAVVVVDVLYLLPAEQQRALLLAAWGTVRPGGVLVVKEMSTEPTWKARWNAAQETMSVKVLRITEGSDFAFVPPAEMAGWLRSAGADVRLQRLDRGRLHPHHLLVAEKR